MRAQQTVELRPYDVEAWSVLLREAQNRAVNDVRSLYESLVSVFPTTARFWKIFIEQEVRINFFFQFQPVKLTFSDNHSNIPFTFR